MLYIPKKPVSISGKDLLMLPMDLEFAAHRTLLLADPIDDSLAAMLNSALRCLAREGQEDITLYIQSPGGSVSAGLSICDTVRALSCDVCTVACGMVASMAAILLCAAGTRGKRYIQPNAEVLIHQPLGVVQGQASDIHIHAEHILNTRARLNRILAECTGQSIDRIRTDTERDTILDARAAVDYGLADQIGDPISEW